MGNVSLNYYPVIRNCHQKHPMSSNKKRVEHAEIVPNADMFLLAENHSLSRVNPHVRIVISWTAFNEDLHCCLNEDLNDDEVSIYFSRVSCIFPGTIYISTHELVKSSFWFVKPRFLAGGSYNGVSRIPSFCRLHFESPIKPTCVPLETHSLSLQIPIPLS